MSDKSDIHFLVESKKCTVKVNNVNVICDKIRLWIYLNFNFLHFRKATFLVNRRSDLYSKFHLFPFKSHCIVYEQILNIKLKHMRRKMVTVDKLYVLYGHWDSRNEIWRSVWWLCLGSRLLVLYLHPHLALHAQRAAHRRPHVPAGAALVHHIVWILELQTKVRNHGGGLLLVERAFQSFHN